MSTQDISRATADRLRKKEAIVGIVGLGYVGLPLMLRYAEVGYKVLGFDVDVDKVASLNRGRSYIEHISATTIAAALERGFVAVSDVARLRDADALIICVPTPLKTTYSPPPRSVPSLKAVPPAL